MAFEGEPRVIPIKGIARAGADSIVEDGAMNEVIGLEYKDGSFVPYSGTDNGHPFRKDVQKFYVHKTSTQTNVILQFADGLYWISESGFYDGEWEEDLSCLGTLYIGKAKDVEFIKNIICISTEDELLYMIFQEGEYKDFNVNKENLPRISFRVGIGLGGNDDDIVGVCAKQYGESLDDKTAIALMSKARGQATDEGGLTGYIIVCAAYRLITGDYVKASAPVIMCSPMFKHGKYLYNSKSNSETFTIKALDGSTLSSIALDFSKDSVVSYYEGDDGFIKMYRGEEGAFDPVHSVFSKYGSTLDNSLKIYKTTDAFYPTMSCGRKSHGDGKYTMSSPVPTNKLQLKIKEDIAGHDMIIDSLCIFVSNEVDPYKTIDENSISYESQFSATSIEYDGNDYRTYKAKLKSVQDIKKELLELRNFYLVKEIKYKEIKKTEDWEDVELKGKLGENLSLLTTLPISAFDNNIIKNASLSSYNSRLHIYNYTQGSSIGFDIEDYNLYGGYGQYSWSETEYKEAYVIIDSKSQNEIYRTIRRFDAPIITSNSIAPYFNPLISSHIDGAVSVTIMLRKDSEYGWLFGKFNMDKTGNGGYYAYIDDALSYITFTGRTDSLPTSSSDNINRSVLRVSDTFLPQTFPYANTYAIGNGTIIGLASLSISLSQDTFGSYPLLVFTTDGIYSMEVDKTGVGVYTNVPPPFSREVCVNPNSICEIDGAVLFASSKGLMIATSQGVQEFVPTMNGLNRHIPKEDNSYGVGLRWYYDIINNSSSTQLLDSVDDELDFRDYIAAHDTYITYVSQKNKIVVYNGNQPYIYWIDIPTRNVTKLPTSIKMDNDNYPTELYVKADGSMLEFNQLSAKGNTQTMFQTRPIKLDGGMKTDYRVVVRGHFESDEQDKIAALLVLGSYDGECWQPIGYKEKSLNGSFNDIGCDTDRVTHKYMMIIFSASLNRDSHIDGIELTKKNKYNNKLK